MLRARGLEEVRLGACREDQVVAGVGLAGVGGRAPGDRIDADDGPALGLEVLVFLGDLAQRVRDVARDQHRRGDLVQQGLELVVVVLVDQRDGDVVVRGECPSTSHAGESTTNDHDAWGLLALACCRPPSYPCPPGDGPGRAAGILRGIRGRRARGALEG